MYPRQPALITKRVLPNSDNSVSLRAQQSFDLTVTAAVGLNFLLPKTPPRTWHVATTMFASMPEAAVHKDCDTFVSEVEIWTARNICSMASPAA
jgi:hypothetical protein